MTELYVSTDVETDGPIPGPHSMLSFGSAAYAEDKKLIATFSANLQTLAGASAHPKTAEWWATQPKAWEACRQNLEPPAEAMHRYLVWLKSCAGDACIRGVSRGLRLSIYSVVSAPFRWRESLQPFRA